MAICGKSIAPVFMDSKQNALSSDGASRVNKPLFIVEIGFDRQGQHLERIAARDICCGCAKRSPGDRLRPLCCQTQYHHNNLSNNGKLDLKPDSDSRFSKQEN